MPTRGTLIRDFYRAMAEGGSRDTVTHRAYRLFIEIAHACGYQDEYEHKLAYKGLDEIASENTDYAATALTIYALKINNFWTTSVANRLADMTTPAATAALEELVRKTKRETMHNDIVAARDRHLEMMKRR